MTRETRTEWFKRYGVYLKSDVWKHKRSIVLSRNQGNCEKCGLKRSTQCHHTKKAYAFIRKYGFGSEPLDKQYLMGLCEPCHSKIHKRKIGGKTKLERALRGKRKPKIS